MNDRSLDIWLTDLAMTQRVGEALGRSAAPGLVIGLIGPLGAGKTTLTRAVAAGLDVPPRQMVTSPTFVLIQEYDGRLPIYHFDTYRLADPTSFLDLGVGEYFSGDGVCLVEWADRVAETLPADRWDLTITPLDDGRRHLHADCIGERFVAPFRDWRQQLIHAGIVK